MIKTYPAAFRSMGARLRKSHLQTALKAAHIRGDAIELEFRVSRLPSHGYFPLSFLGNLLRTLPTGAIILGLTGNVPLFFDNRS